jgi:Plant mobile domain
MCNSTLQLLNRQMAHRRAQQGDHRTVDVAAGELDSKMLVKRTTTNLFWLEEGRALPHPVLRILHRWGLSGVARCGMMKNLDNSLITALVERWHRETHSFHFPFGEATVTLQDVAVIWGLPIEGDAMIGDEAAHEGFDWADYIQRMLGIQVGPFDFKGSRLKITTLSYFLWDRQIPDNSDETLEVLQYARGVALLLFSCMMFPDTTNNWANLIYLKRLETEDMASNTSWGSAVLACLYRNLCAGIHRDRKQLSGPLDVLVIWAWTRISVIRPSVRDHIRALVPISVGNGITLPVPPLAARYIILSTPTQI